MTLSLNLKKYLNNKFFTDNRYFDYNMITGTGSKILTQIRLGLSPLGEHLYTYNLSDNPFCQNCLTIVESTAHFLFHCNKYEQERVILLNNPDVVRLDLYPNNSTDIDELVNTYIRGRGEFDSFTNSSILYSVARFISHSKRFEIF